MVLEVKDDANGTRNGFGRKYWISCSTLFSVSDRNIDQRQVDIDMDGLPWVNDVIWGVILKGVNRHGLSGQQRGEFGQLMPRSRRKPNDTDKALPAAKLVFTWPAARPVLAPNLRPPSH